ncbi:MAG: transglutaminase family protein [Alphaproteobacteria bacterium]|nr:transglutaminase family protein [Alphaproteobacteria bacterium]
MIYDIRHTTIYEYGAPVADARCVIRLTPAHGGAQELLAHALQITPTPQRMWERAGFFGERVMCIEIESAHQTLKVESRARAQVTRDEPDPDDVGSPWEEVKAASLETAAWAPQAPAQFLYPAAMTPLHEPATEYARASFTPGRPILPALMELAERIHKDFAYDTGATLVTTPLAEAFARRHGVCQDFAHIMIAALRGLGLPAAYVSGYLRTKPAPGQPRLEGADAMHAWIEAWCGPRLGWIGFDPTNALRVSNDHIAVATGRDYADVPPIQGVFLGSGAQGIQVAVDVTAVS